MTKFFLTMKTGVMDFLDDECMVSGAALAYYTVFSLPPLLALVFYIAGWFGVSHEKINEVVSRQLGMPVPANSQPDAPADEGDSETSAEPGSGGGTTLDQIAQRRQNAPPPLQKLGLLSKVIGAAILIFSATGLFAQLQRALNRAWEVEPDPEAGGWKNFLVKRVLSLGMVVVIAFLLLVSLVMTTLVDELLQLALGTEPGPVATGLGIFLNNASALLLAALLFTAMYKILPDANMRWKDIWVGAFVTALLFVVGKALIGWYLQHSAVGSAWGSAAASMIALLVWVYYTSLIVLFGAEMTQAWAKNYGPGIVPENGAVRVAEHKEHIRETAPGGQEQPSADH